MVTFVGVRKEKRLPFTALPSSPAGLLHFLIPYSIRLATRIGSTLEDASTRIASDDSVQARAFPPIRVGFDFVPALAEHIEYVRGNSPFRPHQTRVVG